MKWRPRPWRRDALKGVTSVRGHALKLAWLKNGRVQLLVALYTIAQNICTFSTAIHDRVGRELVQHVRRAYGVCREHKKRLQKLANKVPRRKVKKVLKEARARKHQRNLVRFLLEEGFVRQEEDLPSRREEDEASGREALQIELPGGGDAPPKEPEVVAPWEIQPGDSDEVIAQKAQLKFDAFLKKPLPTGCGRGTVEDFLRNETDTFAGTRSLTWATTCVSAHHHPSLQCFWPPPPFFTAFLTTTPHSIAFLVLCAALRGPPRTRVPRDPRAAAGAQVHRARPGRAAC